MTEIQSHTVGEIRRKTVGYLGGKRLESPEIACDLLLARLLGCRHLEVALHNADVLSPPRVEAMRRAVKRLADGEPVQYILGETEFMGHRIKVDRRVLIPRPETEVLVSTVLACAELWKQPEVRVTDVGTGSGCIAVSIARERPQARLLALDISEEALELARENAAKLGVDGQIVFACAEMADVLEPETVDIVVSNPPYVRSFDWERLAPQVRDYEPRVALDGGKSGLDIIAAVAEDAMIALREGGGLFLEVGAGQAQEVASMLESCDYRDVAVIRDLAGCERIVSARRG